MNFLVDPYILATPVTKDPILIEDYLFNLQTWICEVTNNRHKFWLSYYILTSLVNAGLFPTFDRVVELLMDQKGSSSLFDPTIYRAFEQTLVIPPYIDDELGGGCMALNDSTTIIIPDQFTKRLNENVVAALKETFAELAYAKEKLTNEIAISLLFATDTSNIQDDTIGVKAEVCTEEEDQLMVESSWSLITAPFQLNEIENLAEIWEDTNYAVQWAYQDLCNCGVLNPESHILPKFKVGSSFNKRIRDYHWHKRPDYLSKIFRAAVKVLTGLWKKNTDEVHELRVSSASSRQRVRAKDRATAWRVQVTRGTPAIRLHYWLTLEGVIELSTVGPHEDYDIE
ncbi:MAG: hypothetical protein KJ077_24690 [Anaerolineae bacterium]|nr:hypothetical protein [Anaerolineae bacterium]